MSHHSFYIYDALILLSSPIHDATVETLSGSNNGRYASSLAPPFLSILECLLCTGVIFGLAALQRALKRDGAYEELCVNLNDASGDGTCNARQLKFNAMYTGGTVSVPLSMMFWGVLLDSKIGAKRVRWMSLMLFIVGCVLLRESDTRTFDAYIAACVLLSSGGAGFFLATFSFASTGNRQSILGCHTR